jgi:hypothetical protein
MADMFLPSHLAMVPEETAVVGDLQRFMIYIESVEVILDWHERCQLRQRELDEYVTKAMLLFEAEMEDEGSGTNVTDMG